MAFLNSLNTVGSALTAEQFRTSVILQNIANANTVAKNGEDPYTRKHVVFQTRDLTFAETLAQTTEQVEYENQLDRVRRIGKDDDEADTTYRVTNGGGGVRVTNVVENDHDYIPVYDPTHPEADADGYVYYPNVNTTEEIVDLMEASRAYEANVTALSVVKAMASKALEIGR
ncbi:MAG: flagellar basal body rod protein FlgC [Ruminococcus sp.]|nr:flagellar basal body rod protein FlgC [Ruminococcus sp.]